MPAPQLEQDRQSASVVALQAEAWYWPAAQVEQLTQTPPLRKCPGAQLVQAPLPVQTAQSTSQAAQVASLVPPQVAVWYWPAPQTLQAPQVASLDPPQAAVWYWPAAQVEQVLQTVSLVAVQAAAWNRPRPQVAQATQALPTRWYPGAHELHVEAPLQVAQPAGQAPQVASVVAVQAAV